MVVVQQHLDRILHLKVVSLEVVILAVTLAAGVLWLALGVAQGIILCLVEGLEVALFWVTVVDPAMLSLLLQGLVEVVMEAAVEVGLGTEVVGPEPMELL